jgi:hypothetical protein
MFHTGKAIVVTRGQQFAAAAIKLKPATETYFPAMPLNLATDGDRNDRHSQNFSSPDNNPGNLDLPGTSSL